MIHSGQWLSHVLKQFDDALILGCQGHAIYVRCVYQHQVFHLLDTVFMQADPRIPAYLIFFLCRREGIVGEQ